VGVGEVVRHWNAMEVMPGAKPHVRQARVVVGGCFQCARSHWGPATPIQPWQIHLREDEVR